MESNISEVEIPPVLLTETIKQENEENEHAKTEKLNLFLQKQLYHMDNILVKKHAKIVDLKVKLEHESKQRQVAEQKVKTLRELVGFYIAEISELIKNLNANTFPEDNRTDHNASSLQVLNLLTSEVSQWFVKCSKHHCKVRQEVSEMQENLARLEQTLTVRPTTNSCPVEVITIDCSSPANSEQIQDVHNPISTLETGLNSRNISKRTRTRATCRKCGKTFTTRKILYAHHKAVHGCRMGKATKRLIVPITSTIITGVHRPGTDGRYHGKDASKSHLGIYCVCGMKYRYKSSLNEHIGVLTTEWRFTCNICHKKFYRGAHLRHHMKKAHNARATTFVRCHHCAKQFNDLAQLLRHRRISHSNISKRAAFSKPNQRSPDYSNPPPLSPHFSNEMMHKQLENNSDVTLHDFAEHSTDSGSNNNSNNKPTRFYCTCSIGFSTRKLLAHHIKAKITGKVFKCSLCPSAFDTHNNLKLHVRNSHKVPYTNGKYGCRDCGSTFHSYQELMSHRLSNHYTFSKH